MKAQSVYFDNLVFNLKQVSLQKFATDDQ